VGLVAVLLAVVLLAFSGGYDYHRDELYFRVLGKHLAWGFVDQPPLTPLLTRISIDIFGDHLWAIRVPSALIIGAAAVIAAYVAREVGGRAGGQTLAALGLASAFPLIGGHVISTATPDIVFWLLVILFAMRALLRDRPKYWLALGVVAGLALYNKHLIILLLLMLGVGLLIVGPRRVLASPWVWGGIAIAVVLGSPNLIYQLTHDLPQLKMAQALARNKGGDSRPQLLPFQIIMLGPPLVPIWIAGLVSLFRNRQLRPIRALAVAYLGMIVVLFVIAGQPYYTIALQLAIYAIGSVATARWLAGHRGRQVLVAAGVVLNVAVSLVIALPIVPLTQLKNTPITDVNQVTRDQIGWKAYVRQVADAVDTVPAADRADMVIITGNYGEYGALARYGPPYHLPPVYSGQNALYFLGRPPESARVALLVIENASPDRLNRGFGSCQQVGKLDNEVGIDNEEQSATLWLCRDPKASWTRLWPSFQHYD
jgi:4-amino-4-deoxy-L-arabinose transferase-like glycosyltransferase